MTLEVMRAGWSWHAFIMGPFWYFSKKMYVKGFWLLLLTVMTCFTAIPFILVYCGARGRGDLYNFRLKTKSNFDFN